MLPPYLPYSLNKIRKTASWDDNCLFGHVTFDNLIQMKLNNLLILNKTQKCKRNNKALKKTKQVIYISKTYIVM